MNEAAILKALKDINKTLQKINQTLENKRDTRQRAGHNPLILEEKNDGEGIRQD